MLDGLTKSERETLKAIYRFTRDGSKAHTGTIAESLSLSPGTVSTLVKRLADRKLVDHQPYQGISFTDRGRRAAIAAIRRHRIVERFLADMLGYAWNQADALAVSFEHDVPDEVIDRLFVALDRPATCPHGFPIPEAADRDMPVTPQLYDLEVGDIAQVAVSGNTESEILQFLEDLGVVPGAEVRVLEKHPFDGPLVVEVEGKTRTLGERVARRVYVATRTLDVADEPAEKPASAGAAPADTRMPGSSTRSSSR